MPQWPSKNTLRDLNAVFVLIILLTSMMSETAFALVAEVVNYVRQYQVGVDYSNSIDRVDLTYEMNRSGAMPSSCVQVEDDSSKQRCSVGMIGGSSNGWGIFLQKAFKKQGFYYLDWDVGFGARYLSGELPKEERSLSGLPLKNASFRLGAAIMKPYIQFGITPDRFPDILISLGPAMQVAVGTVSINDQSESVAVGTSSVTGPLSVIHGFFALELVLKRFGDGAFSLLATRDVTGHGRGSEIYPKSIDGMSNFRGAFSHDVGGMAFGFGLKLVTPWP
jgi:hypothetical protein